MILTRRTLVQLAGAAGLTKIVGVSGAFAEERQFKHATSLFKDIKYPPDFKHFDYVNPDAPKGGKVRVYGLGSFDSLNTNTYKGESAAYGGIATEALMSSALDEPSTMYGLIASEMWNPEDYARAVYRLRPQAKYHDGEPVKVSDVAYSLETLKSIHPFYASYYKNVVKAEQTGDREVTFVFSEKGNRELPHIIGQIPVLPQHWWTGKRADGKPRDIAEPSLEIPLGSGSYQVSNVRPGQSVTVKRVADYWGRDLPVNAGQDNFEEMEFIYYLDGNVALEAFKGDQYDFRAENSAKSWATGYDFPAIKNGRVLKEEITLNNVEGMQSWAFNLRRAKFQDARLRQAFNYAYDFEWANENLFYDQYKRSRSFFNNSELEAKGLPSPEELAILEPFRADLPPEVFTSEYANPVNNTPQDRRKNLRMAQKLLAEAGWTIQQVGEKSALKSAAGETLAVEILLDSALFERLALPYSDELQKLGINVTVRTIDSAQYEQRVKTFDYDIIVGSWGQSLSPGNEQRDFWGSAAADFNGSRNYAGIKNKAIDALVEKVIFSKDRQDLIAASRALDRALIWNHFVVPQYFAPVERVAHWDRLGRPAVTPAYSVGFPTTWWWDEAKAKKTAAAK